MCTDIHILDKIWPLRGHIYLDIRNFRICFGPISEIFGPFSARFRYFGPVSISKTSSGGQKPSDCTPRSSILTSRNSFWVVSRNRSGVFSRVPQSQDPLPPMGEPMGHRGRPKNLQPGAWLYIYMYIYTHILEKTLLNMPSI